MSGVKFENCGEELKIKVDLSSTEECMFFETPLDGIWISRKQFEQLWRYFKAMKGKLDRLDADSQ